MKNKQEIIESGFRSKHSGNDTFNRQRPQVICQIHQSLDLELTIFKGADRDLTMALAKLMMDYDY